jgi:8-oxo-dGTP pyrophosphatase MutT (NUDIX family)
MARRTRARVERSAGGVVVRTIDGEHRILVIRDPYKNWGLPKGHLEKGEKSGEAATREVREETGLKDLVLGPELATIDWYFRSDGKLIHKFCAFYLMESASGEPVPEAAEGITECVWMSLDEAAARISYDNARDVVTAAREALDRGALDRSAPSS